MRLPVLAAFLVTGSIMPASAQQLELPGVGQRIAVHGFVSQGFLVTTDNNYLASSERGSFELSEVGLNFTMPITDSLRAGLQLFARDLGPIGNYSAKLDWFYLDYRRSDQVGFRAGRVKLPFGLYNEASDADPARVPVLLPQGVYPTENRDFLLAQTGAELYGYLDLGGAGALDWRLYGGTIFLEVPADPRRPFTILDLAIPYVAGGRLIWEAPLDGLRLAGSVQALRLESDLLVQDMTVEIDLPAVLWLVSAEYTRDELLLAAEYGRWHVELDSSNPELFPESSTVSERAYAMASYRVNPRLQAGVYYSMYFPDVDNRSDGRASHQHDVAATLRIDLNDHWLLKLEAHYLNGTAALDDSLNDAPASMLEPDWGLFLVKTTAYF